MGNTDRLRLRSSYYPQPFNASVRKRHASTGSDGMRGPAQINPAIADGERQRDGKGVVALAVYRLLLHARCRRCKLEGQRQFARQARDITDGGNARLSDAHLVLVWRLVRSRGA